MVKAPAPTSSRTVTFARNFDYTHRSRAVTAFKAGWSGRVRGHIAAAADAAGALDNSTPAVVADASKES